MVDKIVCRCCLAQKPPAPNQWKLLSEAQKYLDLLKECFNINLAKSLKSGICGSCAKDVAACNKFRQKVLNAEAMFANLYGKIEGSTIKEELDSDGGADAGDSDDNFLASTAKIQGQIKTEHMKEKAKSLKRKNENKNEIKTLNIFKIGQCTVRKKEVTNAPISQLKRYISDKEKHVENLETILECSNVTIFKKTSLQDYHCAFCELSFHDPAELRNHAERNHSKDKVNRKWQKRDILEQTIKVDITDLKCNMCDHQIANLQLLKLHLQNVHGKTFHDDIKDHLIPFKLTLGKEYNCVLCPSTYETYKMLSQHMNTHYRNYKCDKCESSFAAKQSLQVHQKIHVHGEYKCNLCENVYSSNIKLQCHVKKKHLGQSNISKCNFCDAPFKNYYRRNLHMKEAHNIDSLYKCKICDRDFLLKALLMSHIKRNHLMERNVKCDECGYEFFNQKALKAHMVKHTGEKNYSCSICNKAYGRRSTLKEHMRIHNNDRRFKCEVCELWFVQKCSLKSHLLSNHGISMPASEISVASTD